MEEITLLGRRMIKIILIIIITLIEIYSGKNNYDISVLDQTINGM